LHGSTKQFKKGQNGQNQPNGAMNNSLGVGRNRRKRKKREKKKN
jgi:hypothetical protein